jgi:hypothetical protein
MTSTRGDTRWRRGPAVLHRRTADGPLVLPPGGDQPTLLTGTSAAIWWLLDEPLAEHALAARLADAVVEAMADEGVEALPGEPAWRADDALADALPPLVEARIIEAEP